MAIKGQIVDASIVNVPKQRNSREENARIQGGDIPEDWPENKREGRMWMRVGPRKSSIDVQGTGRQQDQVQDSFADRTCLWGADSESGQFVVAHDRHSPSQGKDWFAELGVQH